MAISLPRVSGSALQLAQANRPDKQNFAISGWARLDAVSAVVTNLFDYFQEVADSGSASWNGFVTASDGITLSWWSGGSLTSIATLTANQWFWWAMRANSTTTTVWVWTSGGGLVSASRANTLTAGTTGFFDIGSHKYGEPWEGPIFGVKIFNATITDAEILNEQWSVVPRTVNKLHSWYPMLNSVLAEGIKDFSGNGRDLTSIGGTSPSATVDSPYVPYSGTLGTILPTYLAPINGTGVSNTISNVTVSATGTVRIAGVGANNSINNFTVSATGIVRVAGVGANNPITNATLSGTGIVRISGTLSQTIAPFTSSAVGSVLIKGILSTTFSNFVSTATGKVGLTTYGILNTSIGIFSLDFNALRVNTVKTMGATIHPGNVGGKSKLQKYSKTKFRHENMKWPTKG